MQVKDSPSLNSPTKTGELTIEFWIKFHSFDYETRWQAILYKEKGLAPTRDYILFFDNQTKRIGLSLGDGKEGWFDCVTTKNDWQLERWYHCAAVYDRKYKRASWYVDGKPDSFATTDLDVLIDTDVPLIIGSSRYTLHFSIDELIIYDRVLTPAEIKERASTKISIPARKPIAYWTFDEGQDDTATDRSGNGNNAVVAKSRIDEAIELAQRYGLSVLGSLCYTPRWALDAPEGDPRPYGYPPKNLNDWNNYVYRVVDRYKKYIKHWGVWNEPDMDPYWAPEPNPEEYAKLLAETYRTAKKVDKNCVILAPLHTAAPLLKSRPNPWDFIDRLFRADELKNFDVFAIQPYYYPTPPEEIGLKKFIEECVERMRKAGGQKKISFTELGVATHIGPDWMPGSSEHRQARMLARSYIISLASPHVDKIFWFRLLDPGVDRLWLENTFGVVYHDWTPKPAYFAYRTLATELGDAKPLYWLTEGPNIYACLFERDKDCVLAAWSVNYDSVLTFHTDVPEVTVINLMGNTRLEKGIKGIYNLPVDENVILVSGLKEVKILQPLVELELDEKPFKIGRRENAEIRVKISNPFDQSFEGKAEIRVPAGLITKKPVKPFKVAPKGQEILSLQVQPAPGVALGKEFECEIEIRSPGFDLVIPLPILVRNAPSNSPPIGAWSFDEGAGTYGI